MQMSVTDQNTQQFLGSYGPQHCIGHALQLRRPLRVWCSAQVREQLQAKSVEEKRRQLRRIESHIAAKEAENASVAMHLTGQ